MIADLRGFQPRIWDDWEELLAFPEDDICFIY